MIIIPTTSAEHLGKIIKNKNIAGLEVIFLGKNKDNSRYFPDGELYVKLPEASDLKGRTIILHSGSPLPNDGLIELKMVLEILKESQAGPLEVFFTYFPYGMQDHSDQPGATNMAKNVIKELVYYYRVEKIYAIDPHFGGKHWVKKFPVISVSAVDLLEKNAQKDYPKAVFMAPDMGSQVRTGLSGTEKKRQDSFNTEIACSSDFEKAIKNKTVAVVDDLLETGGTLERFHEASMNCGAKDAIALITHGVLKKGIERTQKKYSRLYLANTVNQPEANIDVSDLILESLKKEG